MSDQKNEKPQIIYPCQWGFKVIGTDEDAVRGAVKACLEECLTRETGQREYEIGFSRMSGKGNYVSLTLNLEVQDEAERNHLFQTLAKHSDVKMVI